MGIQRKIEKGLIKPGVYLHETKAGILSVEVKEDSSIMLEQNTPSFHEIVNKKEITDSLNITENIRKHQNEMFVMEQGYSMKQPSEIIVELIVEGLEVIGVKVGGKVLNL